MGLLDSIFARGEAEKSRQLDARLDELNRASHARGVITLEELERRQGVQARDAIPADAVSREFDRAFKEAATARAGQIRTALEAPANWTLRAMPWWLWAGLALWAAVHLGLPAQLLRALRSRA